MNTTSLNLKKNEILNEIELSLTMLSKTHYNDFETKKLLLIYKKLL